MATASLETRENRRAWGFVTPALLWTVAFFIIPFIVMAAISLATRKGRELVMAWNFDNYIEFFEKAHLLKGLFVSL
ncbi:MAG TPA: spermidine/putrescine ABC transporter permease, partial [Thalassospira sp.]|nr:spermidine/putrescine ABC transporter permease [Thalassospira sp.]